MAHTQGFANRPGKGRERPAADAKTTTAKRSGASAAASRFADRELATALGCRRETIVYRRQAGMPMPAAGENLVAWKVRAQTWLRKHGRRAGRPKLAGAAARWSDERMRAKVLRQERKLERTVAKWHGRAWCNWSQHQRAHAVRVTFRRLPDIVLANITAAPLIHDARADLHVRMRDQLVALHSEFLRLVENDDDSVHDVAAVAPEGPDPMAPLRVDDRETPPPPKGTAADVVAQHWLGRFRRCAAKREQLELLLEDGTVHDAEDCQQRECARLRACMHRLWHLPDAVASKLLSTAPDHLRGMLHDEVERALAALVATDDNDDELGAGAAVVELVPSPAAME
jgi:hypothetical protein